MEDRFHLYFHSPCFDGIVSCVLTQDFLELAQGSKVEGLIPVNYDLKNSWLSTPLTSPSAVVDFLYHPRAEFWADHHLTTFLTSEAELHFKNRKGGPYVFYEDTAGSCAGLLWRQLLDRFSYRNDFYEPLIHWAEKIDAARYDSVEEAVLGDNSALRIRSSLTFEDAQNYSVDLVHALREKTMDEVAELAWVNSRVERARNLLQAGLDRFSKACHLESDIAVFDVDTSDVLINRYAPYFFFPHARYSIGILRTGDKTKITAMRNPWRDFSSLPLGPMFEKLGGGGHQRVGSLVLPRERSEEAPQIVKTLVKEMSKSGAPAMEGVSG